MENENNKISNEIETDYEQDNTQEVEQITKDWIELNQKQNLRNGRKGNKIVRLLITLIVVLILLVGGGFTYFKFFKPDAQEIYSGLIKKYGHKTSKYVINNLKKVNESYLHEGNITIDSDMDDYKMLNQITLDYTIGGEPKLNTFASTFDYKEKNKDIFKGNIYIKDNKLYIKSTQIYDKVLYYNDVKKNASFNNLATTKDIDETKYLIDKITEYIRKALENANYKTEYKKITLKGKPTLVQQNIMTIEPTSANEIKNEFFVNLKADSKCIKTLADYSGQTQKDLITKINENISQNISKDALKLEIELNTGIINNKLASLIIKEDGQKIITITNSASNTYKITLSEKNKEIITSILKINHENNIELETNYEKYKYYLKLVTNSDQTNIKYDIKVTDTNDKYITISGKNNTNYNNKIGIPTLTEATDIEKIPNSELSKIQENIDKVYKSSELLNMTTVTEKDTKN